MAHVVAQGKLHASHCGDPEVSNSFSQQSNAVIPLPDASDNSRLNRRIIIPVDIPQVRVVHTADLRILRPDPDDRHSLAAVGRPLAAELRIKHTVSWDGTDTKPDNPTTPDENEAEPLEFSYEIHANPEVWLIGGKRRGNFRARENETHMFPIMLLPQRHGHLLLPGLDVKAFEVQTSTPAPTSGLGVKQESANFPPARKQVQSELDYRNHGESVLVLPDLKSTTVSLDPGGPGGGSWLVESERRVEMSA